MNRSNGRAVLGGLFIIIGLLLILDNFTFVRIHIFSWPVILIIIGGIILSNSHRSNWGFFLVGWGIFGLLSRTFGFSIEYLIGEYWPVAIILLGLYMILRRENPAKNSFENSTDSESDFIDDTSVFADNKRTLLSKNFKGGKITTLFGSTSLNLRETELAEGNQILDIVSIFGGVTIEARNDFNIVINVSAIFGGFEDKRRKAPNEIPQSDRGLTIKGLTLFGGGVIYN